MSRWTLVPAGRTVMERLFHPSNERIVSGEPLHAQNHVVAFERSSGESGRVGDRISFSGGEGACGGDLPSRVDDGSIC